MSPHLKYPPISLDGSCKEATRKKGLILLGVNALLIAVLSLYAIVWWGLTDRIRTARIDFISFHTVGKLLIAGEGQHLYDIQKQTQVQRSLMQNYVFQGGALLFVHPPFQSIVFLPLGILPFVVAYCVWVIVMIWLGWLSVSLLLELPHYSGLLAWSSQIHAAAFCFFPVVVSLIQGQDSLMLLFFLTWAFALLKQGKETYAGAVLAFSLFKFHLVLPLYLVVLLKGRWKVLKGSTYSGLLLLALSFALVGLRGILDYCKLLFEMVTWTNKYNFTPSQMRNLRGMLALVLGEHSRLLSAASLILTGLVLVSLMMAWRGDWNPQSKKFDLQFSLTLLAGLLVGHYLYSHDQSILIPLLFILLGVAQSVTRTIGATILVLMALANPAMAISVVHLGQLHLPVNALYLLILFCSTVYLVHAYASLVSKEGTNPLFR
jgi:Glycosyltransferase family 87